MQERSRRELITAAVPAGADAACSPHLVSLVVHARPQALAAVRSALAAIPGTEIHAQNPAGKIVVTLETANEHDMVARMGEIGDLPGVLSTALVFQHSDATERA